MLLFFCMSKFDNQFFCNRFISSLSQTIYELNTWLISNSLECELFVQIMKSGICFVSVCTKCYLEFNQILHQIAFYWWFSVFLFFSFPGVRYHWPFIHLLSVARSFGCTCHSFAYQIEFANWWSDCRVFAKHAGISDCYARFDRSWTHRNNYQSNVHRR